MVKFGKTAIAFMTLLVIVSCTSSNKVEVEELKKRLVVVKEETMHETRRLADVRKKEVRLIGEHATTCVDEASADLEESVDSELEKWIGPLERELDSNQPEEREELKKKVESATVLAGAAVEEKTLDFIKKANACNERVSGVSFKGP